MTDKQKGKISKEMLFRLYKSRFTDSWKIILAREGTVSVIYLSPDLRYWTKCLKVIELEESKAQKYFGYYLARGRFEISDDYKKLVFGR
jgi:hypothetical protein